jgi:hypothetical protein
LSLCSEKMMFKHGRYLNRGLKATIDMIEARELRIGNWVFDDYSGNMIVTAILTGNKYKLVDLQKRNNAPSGRYELKSITGIPLSTYWLERFNIDEYGTYYQAGADSWSLVDDSGDGVTIYLGSCKYVHQLQNLYFALTGTELEFTLDTPQT